MTKPKITIIEGCQGVGKTTVTTTLREYSLYTNLLRLSGVADKTIEGQNKVFNVRDAELGYMRLCANTDMNFVLDRSFITEKVYCDLGFKPYNFINQFEMLCNSLESLRRYYDIKVVLLTANETEFAKRLKRDKPCYTDGFEVSSSMRQQEAYRAVANDIKARFLIDVVEIDTVGKDPFDITQEIIYN